MLVRLYVLLAAIFMCIGSVANAQIKIGDFSSPEDQLLAAKNGNVRAQTNVGDMYLFGFQDISIDHNLALFWFNEAASQGEALAQYKIGNIYHYGLGVEKDFSKARNWYRAAADQGLANAQVNLGVLYQKGLGGVTDIKNAITWYELAAKQGHSLAYSNLGYLYFNGIGVKKTKKSSAYV